MTNDDYITPVDVAIDPDKGWGSVAASDWYGEPEESDDDYEGFQITTHP